jgi:hypothetical protein
MRGWKDRHWSDKLWTGWYQLLLKLKILRLEFHVEEMCLEGDEKFVSLICELRWFFQRKHKDACND